MTNDDNNSGARSVVEAHLEPGEVLREAVAGYSYSGFSRRVIGVTDRRVLVIRSGYMTLGDKGLLWADPVDAVKMQSKVHAQRGFAGAKNGNANVFLLRADGSKFLFNPRKSFFSGGGVANAEKLAQVIPIV